MLQFHIITIFPEVFDPYLKTSILGRAKEKGLVNFNLVDLRDFTTDKRGSVDDAPFGGGAGMILKIEPIYKAVKSICRGDALCSPSSKAVKSLKFKVKSLKKYQNLNIKEDAENPETRNQKPETTLNSASGFGIRSALARRDRDSGFKTILLSAKGQKFTQQKAYELSQYKNVVLICGRYEGVDERAAEHIADEEISIGNYVLTGGELPAMVVADAVSRLIPGVISEESLKEESFGVGARPLAGALVGEKQNNNCITEYPQYTRPAIFKTDEGEEWSAPEVLLSGNHEEIERWRSGNFPS